MDPRCSPKRIGRTHLPNEFTNFPSHGGPPGCAAPTFPGPIQPEPFAVPSDHSLWLHDEQCGAPVPPKAGEPNPKYSIRRGETKPATLRPFQNCKLVADSKNFDLQRCPSPEPRSEAGKQGKKERGKHRAARLTESRTIVYSVRRQSAPRRRLSRTQECLCESSRRSTSKAGSSLCSWPMRRAYATLPLCLSQASCSKRTGARSR